MKVALIALFVAAVPAHGGNAVQATIAAANPIRKVVTMLQAMQKKVAAEGEKEKELYEKFMCYCKNSGFTLGKGIAEAEAKVPAVGSDISESEARLAQLKQDIKNHQADRAAAKSAMAEATALREKEAAAFSAEKSELDANIGALKGAIQAIEKGMSGTFLQTATAKQLQRLIMDKPDLLTDFDRETVTAFLAGSQNSEYVPKSGEITGILKEMLESMSKSLAEAEGEEADSVKSYEELMAAKTKEVDALTKSIESKTTRTGELAVAIVQMKADLSDTQQALEEDKQFLADMDKNCATKTAEHEENMKMRAQELVALADTIKVLNDDDALELFKKTLPSSASSSFVQLEATKREKQQKALYKIREAQSQEGEGGAFKRPGHGRPGLDFIALLLQGKKVDFSKVITMIDNMVSQLKTEQVDDDNKIEYCNHQLDHNEDKKKGLEHSISDLEVAIASEEESLTTLKEEIKALEKGIVALDKSVQEATEQRKEEHEDFTQLMASDSAAKELLAFAKNRLNKFYNPKLYKAPPKRELTDEDRAALAAGGTLAPTEAPGGIAGTGVTVLADIALHQGEAPPPPPATAAAFRKKGEESNGVIAMIDLLIGDLDKEMTEAETTEKNSQAEYEEMMNDSAKKRAMDTKALTDKTGAKAATEESLEANKEEKTGTARELMAVHEYGMSLHSECDWLMKYYDVRKEARAGEVESLKNAKAVLSGADFGFLQTKSNGFLGRGSN
jgi:chromosome segregation ATPase